MPDLILLLFLLITILGMAILAIGLKKRLGISRRLRLDKKIAIHSQTQRIGYFAFACLCLAFLLFLTFKERTAPVRTAHVLFLNDVSKSEAAENPLGTPNSIERSKETIRTVCDAFPDIHTALYAFTNITRSHAYFSHSSKNEHNCGYIKKTLENVLTIESVAGEGSHIANALSVAAVSFPSRAESKIILLFTNGEYTNDSKNFIQTFADIKREGVLLLIVGMGSETGAHIPIYEQTSRRIIDVERTSNGKKVVTALRPATLKTIAKEVNGKYFGENEQGKLLGEIDAHLVKKDEPLQHFYSPWWRLLPLAGFFLAALSFLRSAL